MKPIRFYIAMIVARSSILALKLLGRNASHMPGVIALKICPDVLKYLEPSDTFIAITGTNGKTSTTNMIVDFLDAQGLDVSANLLGSNIEGGVITELMNSTTFSGKSKKEVSVFEIDERASLYIFPYIKPQILGVTNLYRDSYTRNAHVDYIVETLNTSIPDSTELILNADDILCSSLKPNNRRKYFSIAPLEHEEEVKDSIIQDTPYCPVCHEPLNYEFQRYHHVGKVHCKNCGFKSPQANFEIIKITDTETYLKENDEIFIYQSSSDNLSEHYNKLTAIAVLREMGYSHATLIKYFNEIKTVESRFDEIIKDGKRYITILSKDQNPVANSRVFNFIKDKKEWKDIVIVMMTEAHSYNKTPRFVENMAWLYDTNFEYLNNDRIKKIYCIGSRHQEYESRLLYAGITQEKIISSPEIVDVKDEYQTLIMLHNTKNIPITMDYRVSQMKLGDNNES
ncbi:MAG TPA: MurT ligase domain-containing protein [Erysipelothrix sp.]|nr:MurT ligase domain-containing protein [Erysipelothrix sp.]